MHHNSYFPLLVSVASTVKLCHFEVSLSKALAAVIVPLLGLILKAFVASLLLSIEYLGGGGEKTVRIHFSVFFPQQRKHCHATGRLIKQIAAVVVGFFLLNLLKDIQQSDKKAKHLTKVAHTQIYAVFIVVLS